MAEKKKRCLYEILGVSRDSSPEEIRSAYRKLALQLHPDKVAAQSSGAASSEDATAAFQELLHAYEVLSDPRERVYYDSHRSQILFSDPTSASNSKSSVFDLDLFSFFSSSAFSGYSDTGRGFFKVYGDVFAKIYSQELLFATQLGLGPDAVAPAPLMGNLESPYSQVTAFYGYWLGFCTALDFGWVDMYDVASGPNRKARRVMEEENKKVRKKAKREYNDSVRGLTAFVKKRDKRVIDMVMKKKEEEEKRRAEEKEKKKEEERRKMERVRLYEEPEWAKLDQEEEVDVLQYSGYLEPDDDKTNKKKGTADDSSNHELYCVVCGKKFKSEKQWKNHEQSKKHKEKVAELRDSLLEEEEQEEEEVQVSVGDVGDQLEDLRVSFDYIPEAESDSPTEEFSEEFEDDVKFNKDEIVAAEANVIDEEETILQAMISRRKGKKVVIMEEPEPVSPKAYGADSEEKTFMEYDTRKKGRKSRPKRRASKGQTDNGVMRNGSSESLQDDVEPQPQGDSMKTSTIYDENTRNETGESLQDVHGHQHQEDNIRSINGLFPNSVSDIGTTSQKENGSVKNNKLKKLLINGKDAGKKDLDAVSKTSLKGKKLKGGSKEASNMCGTCGDAFDSRNKLFMHLGETGHAMLKSR